MTTKPRTLLIAGIALLMFAGALHLTLRLNFGERAAYVHVRWAPTVDEFARAIIERSHRLQPVEFREQRTWGYFMTDLSADNIRRLVEHPAVEDTHNIDRQRFRILRSAERGDYPRGGPAWVARLLEFFRRISLFGGLIAAGLGAFRLWRDRGPRPTPSQAA